MIVRYLLLLASLVVLAAPGCGPAHRLLAAEGYDVVRPQFADIPVPEGFKYLQDESYSFEYDWKNVRHGRLFYRGNTPAGEIVDFYQDNMIQANWLSAGTAGAKKVMLTYEKGSGATKERCIVTIYALDDKTVVEIQLDPAK